MLEEKRRAVLDRARKTLSEDMTLDTNDLPDEIDLAASEYIRSFEFRLRGREKILLVRLDLALKKIEEGSFGVCAALRRAHRPQASGGPSRRASAFAARKIRNEKSARSDNQDKSG